jgi:hypothetical protein
VPIFLSGLTAEIVIFLNLFYSLVQKIRFAVKKGNEIFTIEIASTEIPKVLKRGAREEG